MFETHQILWKVGGANLWSTEKKGWNLSLRVTFLTGRQVFSGDSADAEMRFLLKKPLMRKFSLFLWVSSRGYSVLVSPLRLVTQCWSFISVSATVCISIPYDVLLFDEKAFSPATGDPWPLLSPTETTFRWLLVYSETSWFIFLSSSLHETSLLLDSTASKHRRLTMCFHRILCCKWDPVAQCSVLNQCLSSSLLSECVVRVCVCPTERVVYPSQLHRFMLNRRSHVDHGTGSKSRTLTANLKNQHWSHAAVQVCWVVWICVRILLYSWAHII